MEALPTEAAREGACASGDSAAAAAAAPAPASAPRRRPGRPPKRPAPRPIPVLGVQARPRSRQNAVEASYGTPSRIKQLFALFKQVNADTVFLRFQRRGATAFAHNHAKTMRIVVWLPGERAHWYYCGTPGQPQNLQGAPQNPQEPSELPQNLQEPPEPPEPADPERWVAIERQTVDKLFAAVDASIDMIHFYQLADTPGVISVILHDSTEKKLDTYRVSATETPPPAELIEAEQQLFPELIRNRLVSFTLQAAVLRKTASDVLNYSPRLTIEKTAKDAVTLTYNSPAVSYCSRLDTQRIGLRCSLPAGSCYRTEFDVTNLKAITTGLPEALVRIYCGAGTSRGEDLLLQVENSEDDAVVAPFIINVLVTAE